jgi:hypothetical protein
MHQRISPDSTEYVMDANHLRPGRRRRLRRWESAAVMAEVPMLSTACRPLSAYTPFCGVSNPNQIGFRSVSRKCDAEKKRVVCVAYCTHRL